MDRVAVVGSGYVGLVTGACLSDWGLRVICVDQDREKVAALQQGIIPIYEPGLEPVVGRNLACGRLAFTADMKAAVEACGVIFIAVGTPSAAGGHVDLRAVETVAKGIAMYMNGYKVIGIKSTVPVGTGRKVKEWVRAGLARRGADYSFDVVANPEFLREGSAVNDFTHPDRVVFGADRDRAFAVMRQVYRVLYEQGVPFFETGLETAEMIKYAANAFLAMKVSFINDVTNLCERVGADVLEVAQAIGKDRRIGPEFLQPGPGYGGSCLPKDTRALAAMGRQYGAPVTLVEQVVTVNDRQKQSVVEKVVQALGDLAGKQLAVLGLAFKPGTNDMREAPSIAILAELARMGAVFKVYDPAACQEARSRLEQFKDLVTYCDNEYDTMAGSDALLIITGWDRFQRLDLDRVKELLKQPYLFDFPNLYRRRVMEQLGFKYYGTGQGVGLAPVPL